MRKISLFIFLLSAFLYGNVFAVGVTVTGNTNTTPPMQASYLTLAAAITDINTITAISGQITFTCAASGSETTPLGGYSITCTNVTGISGTNNIVIDGNSSTITAFTTQTSGSLNDAIFKLIGADYITLKNFTMQENASNTVTAVATNTMTEFGVALLYATATDGAQNNTIQNNTITLNKTYVNTFGIYSNTRHAPNTIANGTTVTADASSAAGSNANNKIYSNAISNVNFGIAMIGGGVAAAIDLGNDIGGSSAGTANTITNWGNGAVTAATFTSVSGNLWGIDLAGQSGLNVSYNTITSASIATSVTCGGIITTYVAAPTGTFTNTISNNTVQITNAPTAATTGGIQGIAPQGISTFLSTATVTISNNIVQNCAITGSTSTTNSISGILNFNVVGTLNITGNNVTTNSISASTATTGSITGISNSAAAGTTTTANITGNTVQSNTISGTAATTGAIIGITNISTATVTTLYITGNTVNNNTVSKGTAAGSGILGISNASASTTVYMMTNTVRNNALTSTTASYPGTFTGISNSGAVGTLYIRSNIIRGQTNNTVATYLGSTLGISNSGACTSSININSNTIGDATADAITYSLATGASINNGIQVTAGAAGCNLIIDTNSFKGFTFVSTTSGTTAIIITSGYVGTNINVDRNAIGSAVGNFATFSAASSGGVTGISNAGGTAAGAISLSNNDIRGIVHTTAGTAIHSYVSNTFVATTIRMSSNTFTNLNVNTTGSVTFMTFAGNLTATGTLSIDSNSTVTAFNRAGGSGTVTFYTSNASSATGSIINFRRNNISSVTLAGTSSFVGINNTDGGSPTKTIDNNTFNSISGGTGAMNPMTVNFLGSACSVSNNTITNITWGAAIPCITIGGSSTSATLNVNNNTINNITSTGGAVTGITSATTSTTTTQNISGNNINTLTSSTASTVLGIGKTGTSPTNISKNKIYDLSGTNASSLINGILLSSGGTTDNIYNNLIGDLRATTATSGTAIYGINLTSATATTTINVYYNSIFITGTGGSGFGSAGIFHTTSATATTAALNMRNNNIVNTATVNVSGFHVAYRRSSATLTNYSATSNNNNFFGTSGLYYDAVAAITTLPAYKTAMSSRDQGSYNESPTYQSTTGSSANFLKFSTSVATQLESGGVGIGTAPYPAPFNDDIASQIATGTIRQGSTGYAGTGTAPDVGAWELNGIALDVTGPSISYTPLGNAAAGATQTLNATISDGSSVPRNGTGLPVLYWKINAGAYSSVTATANGGSSFSFTFGAGTVASDVVSYYIVAQDSVTPTANSSCFPAAGAAGFTLSPPAVSTPPTTPSTYTATATLSGTKTVGSGGDYATLTAAITDLNAKVLNGALVLSLTDASYGSETYPITINSNGGSNATNTVTIKPAAAVTPAFSGSSASALIVVNGADYIILDGSNNGSSSRDITLTNTNAGTSSAVVWLQTATADGATNNTVKNCVLTGSGNLQTLFGVGMGSSAIGIASLGTGNNTNTITNNNISKVTHGIYTQGASSGSKNTGNIITNNLLNTTGVNAIGRTGILVGFENTINISGNTIDGITFAGTGDVMGIACGGNAITSTVFTGNEVSNATISSNKIGTVAQTGTYSASGIFVCPATTGTTTISNNLIYGAGSNGTTGDFATGIFLGGGAGSTTNVYYNSVYMSGTFTGGSQSMIGIAIGGSNPTVDLRNNISYNTQVNGTGTNYAVGLGYATYTNLTSNYNDFISTGQTGCVSLLVAGTNQTTLANWQATTGKDANSISSNPTFNSTTDLQIVGGSPAYHAGTVVSVTTDYTGATRSGSTPSMGAYEGILNAGPSISYTNLGNGISSSNQVLSTTISDPDGVPTAGSGLPVLYYKSTTSVPSYTAVQAVYVSGSNYTFTFGSAVTGTGEVVSYYVAAQDNTPLGSASPSTGATGFTASPPAYSTPPTTPNTYTTVGTLSGTKTVGTTGRDYATLKAAFDDINLKVLTGNLTLAVQSEGTTETATASLNQVSYSGGTYTITIKPASTATITGSLSSTAIVKLNGADNVVIDGSNSGGTDKSLTITNSATTAPSVIWLASQGVGAGANTNTVKNCNLSTGISTSLGFGVCVGGTIIGTSGADNDNVTVQNNTITNIVVGIYAIGTASVTSGGNDNLLITQNTISNNSGNTVTGDIGIQVGNGLSGTISQNTMTMQSSGASSVIGISLETGFVSSTITRNNITAFSNNAAGEGGRGITVGTATASSSLTISNNVLTGINGSNWIGFNNSSSMGIAIGMIGTSTTVTTVAGGINLYNNSVNMAGNYTGTGFDGLCLTTALYVGSGASALDVRNNIFRNSLNNQNTTSGAGATSKNYAIYSIAANTAFTTINYNDYYVAGTQGVLGFLTSDRTNLAGIVTGFGGNTNSAAADPQFASATDLSYTTVTSTATVIPSLNSGVTGTGTTVDYTGVTRSATNPDMGAYEFSTTYDLTGASNTTLPGGNYTGMTWTGNTLTFSGNVTIDGTLNMSNGVIDMGANTLTIGSSTASVGGITRTGGSVKGTIKRWFNTSTTSNSVFPLDYGDGSNYVGANISFTGAPTTGGSLTATYHTSGSGTLSDNGGLGYIDAGSAWPGVNFINLSPQYWTISAGDGLAGFTYTIDLTANNMNVNTTNYLYTGVVKRSNNTQAWGWNFSNHTNTTSPSAVPHLGGTGFTSFSDFGVGGNVDNLLPVELASFTANVDKRYVTLNWSTATEQNNVGFDVERRIANTEAWSKLGNVQGHGTSNTVHTYKYEDRNLQTGKYNYRLKQIDNNGNFKYYTLTSLVEVGIPTKYDMSQNYPNPFNPSTKINYDLPFDSKLTIRIFDITGRDMGQIINTVLPAGYYTVEFNASHLASGTYFYNIMADGNNGKQFITTKKMVLIK